MSGDAATEPRQAPEEPVGHCDQLLPAPRAPVGCGAGFDFEFQSSNCCVAAIVRRHCPPAADRFLLQLCLEKRIFIHWEI